VWTSAGVRAAPILHTSTTPREHRNAPGRPGALAPDRPCVLLPGRLLAGGGLRPLRRPARPGCQRLLLVLLLVHTGEGELAEQALAGGVHDDLLAGVQLAVEDLLRELVLDLPLDRAAQRPGPEHRVVPTLGDQLVRGL